MRLWKELLEWVSSKDAYDTGLPPLKAREREELLRLVRQGSRRDDSAIVRLVMQITLRQPAFWVVLFLAPLLWWFAYFLLQRRPPLGSWIDVLRWLDAPVGSASFGLMLLWGFGSGVFRLLTVLREARLGVAEVVESTTWSPQAGSDSSCSVGERRVRVDNHTFTESFRYEDRPEPATGDRQEVLVHPFEDRVLVSLRPAVD